MRPSKLRRAFLVLATLSLPAAALAQQAAPPAPSDDRVVVEGRRPIEIAREFVDEVADPVSHNFGIARWENRVCVAVENIQREPAQYIVDRISEVALQLGLNPGDPGCRPEIAIVFAVDGQALASYLVEEQARVFRPFAGEGGTTQGLNALSEFASSDAAVRWWQVTMPVDRSGNIAIALPGRPAPQVQGSNSRITRLVHDQIWQSIVIVDVSKLTGAKWHQLADYLAMVTLAQVDPNADMSSFDSILTLPENPTAAPDGMTDWDQIYLASLYEFDQERVPRLHGSGLIREMVREHDDRQQEEASDLEAAVE